MDNINGGTMRCRSMKVLTALCLLSIICCLTPLASLAGEAGLPTVRFVQSGRTASSWPLFIGQEKKFFQKNGIYLEEIIVRGGPNTTRAVLSNTIPIVPINIHNTLPTSPTTYSFSGRSAGAMPALSNIFGSIPGGEGHALSQPGIIRATSAFACVNVTPGFSLPRPW